MKKASHRSSKRTAARRRAPGRDGLRARYDFSGGVRGKYAERYRAGTNIIVLDPDVAARFRDAASVNRVLRAAAELADGTPPKRRSRRRTA